MHLQLIMLFQSHHSVLKRKLINDLRIENWEKKLLIWKNYSRKSCPIFSAASCTFNFLRSAFRWSTCTENHEMWITQSSVDQWMAQKIAFNFSKQQQFWIFLAISEPFKLHMRWIKISTIHMHLFTSRSDVARRIGNSRWSPKPTMQIVTLPKKTISNLCKNFWEFKLFRNWSGKLKQQKGRNGSAHTCTWG